jgi:phosphatidylinositol-3-phosphatase
LNKFWMLLFFLAAQPVLGDELPRPDHIVIVIEENHSFIQIIGNDDARYINGLAKRGMLFTQSYGITHPSQPNYLALFTGTTRGISSDVCPLELSGENLASILTAKGLSFATYAESMPEPGYGGCIYGAYVRKHNPVANWKGQERYSQPFSAFPSRFEGLPTVSFVVPDQLHDMHDGSVKQGDDWLRQNIEPYAEWAMTHNSLLILTWDENNGEADNHIATIMIGPMAKRGNSAQRIGHYNILRTISEMYGLPNLNESAHVKTITGVWK